MAGTRLDKRLFEEHWMMIGRRYLLILDLELTPTRFILCSAEHAKTIASHCKLPGRSF